MCVLTQTEGGGREGEGERETDAQTHTPVGVMHAARIKLTKQCIVLRADSAEEGPIFGEPGAEYEHTRDRKGNRYHCCYK